MTEIRCIVIDPDLRTVREERFEWQKGDYDALNSNVYRLGKFDCFDSLRITPVDRVYVDDDGLFKPLTRWAWLGYGNPLAGIGVILGEQGEHTCSTTLTVEYVEQRVAFERRVFEKAVG